MHVDLAVESRTQDVLAKKSSFPRLRERLLENLRAFRKLSANIDIGEVRPHRVSKR